MRTPLQTCLLLCALAPSLFAAKVFPAYFGIEVPPNIAPLNFDVEGAQGAVRAEMRAGGDVLAAEGPRVRWPAKAWRAFLSRHAGGDYEVRLAFGGGGGFVATNRISRAPVDSHLTYRLIRPGYSDYDVVGIWQRDLTCFDERPLYRNVQVGRGQCVNCHTYNAADPGTYLFHTRFGHDGVQIVSSKYGRRKRRIRMPDGLNAVYPAWHPSGDFVAFSANETFQVFYEAGPDKIEVADKRSDLLLYSLADDRVVPVEDAFADFECYPAWDPAGRRLFTARARTGYTQADADRFKDGSQGFAALTNLCYDLVVRTFDPATRAFSEPRLLVDGPASGRSVSFPRVSPDGRWLVMAVGPCGIFHVWHGASDLWILDLEKGTARPLDELNSPRSESYHCFSRDGRWMVFSSRREDGAYTRPYLAAFDPGTGVFSRPFLLPVEDPAEHRRRMWSYNVPEFSAGPVRESPRDLRRLVVAPAGGK